MKQRTPEPWKISSCPGSHKKNAQKHQSRKDVISIASLKVTIPKTPFRAFGKDVTPSLPLKVGRLSTTPHLYPIETKYSNIPRKLESAFQKISISIQARPDQINNCPTSV